MRNYLGFSKGAFDQLGQIVCRDICTHVQK